MSPLVEELEAEFITNLDNGIELIFPLEGAASVNDSPGAIKRFGCRFGFSFLLRGEIRVRVHFAFPQRNNSLLDALG
jgi:hypothetical protein